MSSANTFPAMVLFAVHEIPFISLPHLQSFFHIFFALFTWRDLCCVILSAVGSRYLYHDPSLENQVTIWNMITSCDDHFAGAAPAPPTQSNKVPRRSRSGLIQRYSQALSFTVSNLVRATAQVEPRRFLFRACWSSFSLDSAATESSASVILCRSPSHHFSVDPRLYYSTTILLENLA